MTREECQLIARQEANKVVNRFVIAAVFGGVIGFLLSWVGY